jgi:hypothetical protein
VIDYAHSLGIKVYLTEDAYLNPLYGEPKENLNNIDAGKYDDLCALTESGGHEPLLSCLSNPVSRDILKRSREIVYKSVHNIDGLVIYFGDPGGCYHPQCRPFGKKIIEYLNDIYTPLLKETNPHLKIVLTLWGIGLSDTEYVVNHIKELPSSVTAIQIPPTNMNRGDYLIFERRRGELIKQAAKRLPVIIQQFHEGVGFRGGQVSGWEHPMPREMWKNLTESYTAGSNIRGVYGSPFDISYQSVDLRLGMEWGWNPKRNPAEILREFGDEQFGAGVGEFFSQAMFGMDDYWYKEVVRFFSDAGGLSNRDFDDAKSSMKLAPEILSELMQAEPHVTRHKLYFKSFTDMAKLMVASSRSVVYTEEARRLSLSGNTAEALTAADEALQCSERFIDLTQTSERYAWLITHPWWQSWDIGKRPMRIREMIRDLKNPGTWNPVEIRDPSFELQSWQESGAGKLIYSSDAHIGAVSAELVVDSPDSWCEINPSAPMKVQPNHRYRVEFWAKPLKGTPKLYLDFAGPVSDGDNSEVPFEPGIAWQKYRVEVRTPDFKPTEQLNLRFVAYGMKQDILIDDVGMWELAP